VRREKEVRESIRREKEVRNKVDFMYCSVQEKKKRNRRERSVIILKNYKYALNFYKNIQFYINLISNEK
jgi:hypothetical protein